MKWIRTPKHAEVAMSVLDHEPDMALLVLRMVDRRDRRYAEVLLSEENMMDLQHELEIKIEAIRAKREKEI